MVGDSVPPVAQSRPSPAKVDCVLGSPGKTGVQSRHAIVSDPGPTSRQIEQRAVRFVSNSGRVYGYGWQRHQTIPHRSMARVGGQAVGKESGV